MNIFKQIKTASILEAICAIVIGFLFIVMPDITQLTIIYLFATLLLVMGFSQIINYFCYGIEPLGFIKGIVNISLGLIFFLNAELLCDAKIFAFTFGIIYVIKGLFEIQWSFDCRRLGSKYWWVDTILSMLVFVFGILLLVNPTTQDILMIILGVTIILEGLSQLIDTLVVSRKIKKVKKSLKSLFTNEHDVIDEQEQNRNKFDKK